MTRLRVLLGEAGRSRSVGSFAVISAVPAGLNIQRPGPVWKSACSCQGRSGFLPSAGLRNSCGAPAATQRLQQ